MADISRAMQTPPPSALQPAPAPPARSAHAGGDPTRPPPAPVDENARREAKNERDRLRRKAKRAADAKAAKAVAKKAAAPKRKKKKAKAVAAPAAVKIKKRGRGRPPGAKNRPKIGVVSTPGTAAKAVASVVTAIGSGDPFAALHTATEAVNSVHPSHRKSLLALIAKAVG